MTGNLKLFELKKLEDTRMKIVIINGVPEKEIRWQQSMHL